MYLLAYAISASFRKHVNRVLEDVSKRQAGERDRDRDFRRARRIGTRCRHLEP